jgi:hypothetical protein
MVGEEGVSSVGAGVEGEHEDIALTVGTNILFRCIHSASEKCWLHTTFQVLCTEWHIQTICPQLSPAKKRKKHRM